MIFNSAIPEAARRAFEQAHQLQGKARHTRTGVKQTAKRDYHLTTDFMDYRAEERRYRESRYNDRRADIHALNAKTYLHTQATPKATARRLDIARMKNAANKVRIARARTPERKLAAMVRHMNGVTHSILKERGYK